MIPAELLLVIVGSLVATILLTRVLLGILQKKAILDRPNQRSSHGRPTPRGGGIAVVSVVALAWTLIALVTGASLVHSLVVAGALALACVSWQDDLGGLPIATRLGAQALGVIAVLAAAPHLAQPFGAALSPPIAYALAAVAWLWFINLYNFMDGIDGITGVETATIGVGIVALAAVDAVAGADGLRGGALAGAGLGFLVWNWHRARIFLGDVGSVPLGFLAGWILLDAAAQGAWAPALILPAYYLADATVTLARRFIEGKRFWEAHREHFYQRAVGEDGRHDTIVVKIIALNFGLVVLALLAVDRPVPALAAAGAATAALIVHLALAAKSRR